MGNFMNNAHKTALKASKKNGLCGEFLQLLQYYTIFNVLVVGFRVAGCLFHKSFIKHYSQSGNSLPSYLPTHRSGRQQPHGIKTANTCTVSCSAGNQLVIKSISIKVA